MAHILQNYCSLTFESWVRSRLNDGSPWTRRQRRSVRASERSRGLKQMVLGKSQLSYFQSLRVERAVHLLKTSSASEETGVPFG
jgi:hypothetical protein